MISRTKKLFFFALLVIILVPAVSFAQINPGGGGPNPTSGGTPTNGGVGGYGTPTQNGSPSSNGVGGYGTPTNNNTPIQYIDPFSYRPPQDVLDGPGSSDWGNTPDYTTAEAQLQNKTFKNAFSSGQCPALITDHIQIKNLIWFIICVIDRYLIPLAFGFGFVFFLWGGTQFIRHAENEELRAKYKHSLVWGIIALFVMLSFWGIIKLMTNTLGFSDGKTIPIPLLKQDK